MSSAPAPIKRYIVVPGIITVNGRKRYVSAPELARLYRVDPAECIVMDGLEDEQWECTPAAEGDLIFLMPDPTGRYPVGGCQL